MDAGVRLELLGELRVSQGDAPVSGFVQGAGEMPGRHEKGVEIGSDGRWRDHRRPTAFPRAVDAVQAAVAAQRTLALDFGLFEVLCACGALVP